MNYRVVREIPDRPYRKTTEYRHRCIRFWKTSRIVFVCMMIGTFTDFWWAFYLHAMWYAGSAACAFYLSRQAKIQADQWIAFYQSIGPTVTFNDEE